MFRGKRKNKTYFEGWYFKQVSSDAKSIISIIPGVSQDCLDTHSFIQIITDLGRTGNRRMLTTCYLKYAIDDFRYKKNPFRLMIGDNLFDRNGIVLNIKNDDYNIKGNVRFSQFTKIHRNITSPSAMGYFAYFNFMECNHDIISMNHSLKGKVDINGEIIDLKDGRGYIEKDWGTSFPSEYIWLQSNHFEVNNTSIMISVARIPFLGLEFQGFICNLILDGREFRFATYNNSKIIKYICSGDSINIIISKGKQQLIIKAKICDYLGILKAPINGGMDKMIKEGLAGYVDIKLLYDSYPMFEGRGNPCAIEVVK